ncbi:MAG: hypothetical protein GX195_10420 [Firmicutes bacterium]|nr:hypothetical protein [Bacillota bacterium]
MDRSEGILEKLTTQPGASLAVTLFLRRKGFRDLVENIIYGIAVAELLRKE